MITAVIRLPQAVEDTKRADAEIESEALLGHLNRFNQSKELQFAAVGLKHLQRTNINRTVSRVEKRRSRILSRAA